MATAKITIDDIAKALGISKTTVSRSISGTGRISEKTRERVLSYIKEHDYAPNPIAKGLAKQRTYNLGWVMPGDSRSSDLPFFQRCLMGVSETAAKFNYDVLISMVFNHDLSGLRRIVSNQKVDGIILSRTLKDGDGVDYLLSSGLPFVTIGSTLAEDVTQIDNDHIAACSELTAILVMKGLKKLMLIAGDSNHMVNESRKAGFLKGVSGSPDVTFKVMMDADTETGIAKAVDEALLSSYDCLICADDKVCSAVLSRLSQLHIAIPGQIKVASFYNSDLLSSYTPAITALSYDPRELGKEAVSQLMQLIDGSPAKKRKLLGYEVLLRGSTS